MFFRGLLSRFIWMTDQELRVCNSFSTKTEFFYDDITYPENLNRWGFLVKT